MHFTSAIIFLCEMDNFAERQTLKSSHREMIDICEHNLYLKYLYIFVNRILHPQKYMSGSFEHVRILH